jgi:hypothetical protein
LYERWSTERKWRRAAGQCLPGHGTIYNGGDEVLYRPGIDEHFATSEYYAVTGLPRKLTHYRAQHAEIVAAVFEAMVDRLDVCLKGNIRWLLEAPALYEWRTEEEEDGPLED